jgi:hypothetical protein
VSDASSPAAIEIRQFKPGFESFGIVVDYLGKTPPFDGYAAGKLVIALKHQIAHGHHVCAFRADRLIGYCGWLYTTKAVGEAWLNGSGELKPVADAEADAAALTIVHFDDRDALRPMIRAIREIGKGRRIFFQRDYQPGREKRQSVTNV